MVGICSQASISNASQAMFVMLAQYLSNDSGVLHDFLTFMIFLYEIWRGAGKEKYLLRTFMAVFK